MALSKKIVRQTVACIPVILLQFMTGVGWGWIGPTLAKLKSADSVIKDVTTDQAAWLASVNEMGRTLGPFLAPVLIDNLGRKSTIVIASVAYLAIWSATIFVGDIYILCGLRVAFGLANGLNDVVVGIYITENCEPDFRGVVGSIVCVIHFAAIFAEFVVSSYTSYTTTAVVNAALAGCVLATSYLVVETPYFLIMKSKRKEAEKNLIWLSGSSCPDDVAEELQSIEVSVLQERQKTESLKTLLFSPVNLRRMVIVVLMFILMVGTGVNSYVTYTSLIFSSSETLTANQYVILYGVAQVLGVLVSPFVIEKVNRRTLMILTMTAVSCSNILSYGLIYARSSGYIIAYYPWLIFASLSLYGIFFSMQMPVSNALKVELLPLSVRAIGSSLATIGNSASSFLFVKMFLPINDRYGMEVNFLVFTVLAVLVTVFVYYILPETRGKTLQELQGAPVKEEAIKVKKVLRTSLEQVETQKFVFTKTDDDE